MGLGSATLNSGLGEPLRLSFPVSLQPNEEAGCVQVRAKSEDLPSVFNTRSSVIRNAFQTRIEVTTAQPVNEPAIGIVVSVGCASPIAREYILFLDPPIVPATESLASDRTSGAVPLPRDVPRRSVPRRRAPAVAAPSESGASENTAPVRQPARSRRARPRPAPVSPAAPVARKAPSTVASSPSAPAPVARGGDRLTVAPTDTTPGISPPAAPRSPASAPSAAPAPPTASPSTTPPVPVSTTPSGVPSTAGARAASTAGTAAPSGAVPTSAGDPADREQALRQQQADLQKQLKSLGDQIAALRVTTTTLATRNQVLEDSALSPSLVWMLIALAALATLVAGWMTWRYTQLRRSMGDAAWWSGNSVLAPGGASAMGGDSRATVAPLGAATRGGQRSAGESDARASSGVASNASAASAQPDRARTAARSAPYPAAMDTDFTVSDIEAAMATVRTVSPPRDAKRPKTLEDSDFAALGNPTQPSPFAEPPPAARRATPAEHEGDDLGKFVDLEIPPLSTAQSSGPVPAPTEPGRSLRASLPAKPEEPTALDFKLDIPTSFDPLATDSLKTTVVDHANAVDFDVPATPTALDFELPSVTSIAKADADFADDGVKMERHGATALGDLFPALGGPGPDTILDLDDRDGSPLSTTEVDRLTTTAVDASDPDSANASTRVRLTRFADLMNQVDEAEAGNDPLRAIAHLRQYVLRDEQIPTLLWLRLFELYRAVDKKPVYDALSEHFARRYQRPMVGWNEVLADRVPQTPLSAMSGIDREIELLWGREEGVERLRQLLCDRDQDDAIVFNAVLQRDLLDAAKVFPREERG